MIQPRPSTQTWGWPWTGVGNHLDRTPVCRPRFLGLGILIIFLSIVPQRVFGFTLPESGGGSDSPTSNYDSKSISQPSTPPPIPTPTEELTQLVAGIDQAIVSQAGGQVAPGADDAEFLRRLWLDMTGRIPPREVTREFLQETRPDKRAIMIDQLLGSPQFARHMQTTWDLVWMERRPDKHVPSTEWKRFLFEAFDQNLPYDQLARKLLRAEGADQPRSRPAAKFVLDRDLDPNVLTRDTARLFLGRDIQCAQCHDHPLVEDYEQSHYFGLYAYFSRLGTFPIPNGPAVMTEKGEGEVTFTSVFKRKVTHKTGPRVLGGPERVVPAFAKGDEYFVKPDKAQGGVPKTSCYSHLAEDLTAPAVRAFPRNAANRLWAHLMGRGLIHPLEFDHSDNPPSHPELLEFLTDLLIAKQYNIKEFLRILTNTQTYQRGSTIPTGWGDAKIGAAPDQFAVMGLHLLGPEALAWSLMEAAGIVAQTERSITSGWGQDPRFRAILASVPDGARFQARLLEDQVHQRLNSNVGPFVNTFAPAAGQPQQITDATVQQALFLANGPTVRSWLQPNGGNLISHLAKLPADAPQTVAEDLYLSILCRRPTPEETQLVADFLGPVKPAERTSAIHDLAWSLVTSVEFRVKH